MEIESLIVSQFRNYTQESLTFHPKCNVIFGENAQGKTNLLEAIAYLSCGQSPRTRFDKELIGFDAEYATLGAGIHARDRHFEIKASLFHGKRRQLQINGVKASTSSALSQVYQTVFFCPEDLQIIRETAAVRRRFLDQALCQLRPRYQRALAQYHKIYQHKIRILRDSEENPQLLSMLPEFNAQMVHFGAIVIHYRAHFVEKLAELAAVYHFECAGGKESLSLHYATVSSVTDPLGDVEQIRQELASHMESHQGGERASRSCLSGPHKDDLLVDINGRSAKRYASQGQTRTAALSIKLAERILYQHTTGEYPILLLDDVLSELDPKRQEFVLNRIQDGQVLITCCEEDRLSSLLGGKMFHVKHGSVQ